MLEKSHGQKSLEGYSPGDHKELATTKATSACVHTYTAWSRGCRWNLFFTDEKTEVLEKKHHIGIRTLAWKLSLEPSLSIMDFIYFNPIYLPSPIKLE